MTLVPHPPNSPDLAPSNFFGLFPRIKKVLKGKHFAYVKEVKQKTAEALTGIKINKFRGLEDGGEVGGSGAQFSLCPAGTPSQSSEEQSEHPMESQLTKFGGKKFQRTLKNRR